MIRVAGIVVASLALLGASEAQALTLQPVGTFAQPTYVASTPSEPNRIFVVERAGKIKSIEGGVVADFADISSRVGCPCTGERGLMSIAFDPDFRENGRLYAFYGSQADGEIHIDELLSAGSAHDSAAFGRNLLSIPRPDQANHYGGQLQFDPDGYLYVSTGDGGGADDPSNNAQNPGSQLGKILRLDPDVPGSEQVWSLGLRNPFRFSFDRLSGDMVIGDVGQDLREEIDLAPSPFPGVVGGQGANYGWDCLEGLLPGASSPEPQCDPPQDFVEPVFDYPHTAMPGGEEPCAIIGGYVVRDPSLGDLYGRYLYGDLCLEGLRSIDLANPSASDRAEGIVVAGLNSFGEDACGQIYVVEGGGRVSRLTGSAPAADCQAVTIPVVQPAAKEALRPTFIGIKPQRRRVEHGKAALLTVWVSPCNGRRGKTVELFRNGHRNGSRFLSRACTARFLPRIYRGTRFTAVTRQGPGYLPGQSRKLTIRLVNRRHRNARH